MKRRNSQGFCPAKTQGSLNEVNMVTQISNLMFSNMDDVPTISKIERL